MRRFWSVLGLVSELASVSVTAFPTPEIEAGFTIEIVDFGSLPQKGFRWVSTLLILFLSSRAVPGVGATAADSLQSIDAIARAETWRLLERHK